MPLGEPSDQKVNAVAVGEDYDAFPLLGQKAQLTTVNVMRHVNLLLANFHALRLSVEIDARSLHMSLRLRSSYLFREGVSTAVTNLSGEQGQQTLQS